MNIKQKIFFCRVSYMKNYRGITENDYPIGGGSHIDKTGSCHEQYNFKNADGMVYGFVQPTGENITLERIGVDVDDSKNFIDNVLVIFFSFNPNKKHSPKPGYLIIGWYKNAKVFRKPLKRVDNLKDVSTKEDILYVISAKYSDAQLVRPSHRKIFIPSKGVATPGQSNVFYCDDQNLVSGRKWINKTLDYINDFEGDDLNQILYGPPGTGKTFETKSIAVKIITGENIKERNSLNKKYNELVSKKRIEFITFHQSYGYEDFVEGIKPKLDKQTEGDVQYEIKKGILRQICDRCNPSSINILDIIENKDVKVWSMRLASSQNKYDFNWTEECFNDANSCIMVGNNPKNKNIKNIKYGDVVVVPVICTSGKEKNKLYCGLGVVIDHECFDYDSKRWARKVEWIWCDTNPKNYKNISNVWSKEFDQNPIYELKGIDKKELLIDYYLKHVLIIDEINRGNLSKILGELITLLEEDKRLGKDEALEVTLPYSNEKFGVPSNLYIIGTMNTADRSIAFLDTALRRRFNFTEMMPKYIEDNGDNLFPDIKTSAGVIDISKMLKQINTRICKELDRDHQIGHSYFISANKSEEIEWLKGIFMNNICPLLDEYFHDRRSKINTVLKDSGLISNINSDNDYWEWAEDTEFNNPKNYQMIYA